MAFINFPSPTPVFPALPPLAWSVHKKPILSSRVTVGVTGRACQLTTAVFPRWAFTLTYGGSSWLRDQTQNITPDLALAGFTELQQLTGLFLACKGAYGEFYYDDPDDDSRELQFIGAGNGTQVSFPILCTWGNGPFDPPFYMIVGGINTIDQVYINGTLQDPSTYSMDATNTALVFSSAPASGLAITVNYHFYYRCRFLDDTLALTQFARNLWEVPEVRFESVKP